LLLQLGSRLALSSGVTKHPLEIPGRHFQDTEGEPELQFYRFFAFPISFSEAPKRGDAKKIHKLMQEEINIVWGV
jgi:hypothetical protein